MMTGQARQRYDCINVTSNGERWRKMNSSSSGGMSCRRSSTSCCCSSSDRIEIKNWRRRTRGRKKMMTSRQLVAMRDRQSWHNHVAIWTCKKDHNRNRALLPRINTGCNNYQYHRTSFSSSSPSSSSYSRLPGQCAGTRVDVNDSGRDEITERPKIAPRFPGGRKRTQLPVPCVIAELDVGIIAAQASTRGDDEFDLMRTINDLVVDAIGDGGGAALYIEFAKYLFISCLTLE